MFFRLSYPIPVFSANALMVIFFLAISAFKL
nr:MAG TPA: hypothetical protein [Caudoviricetes sp.]